MEGWIIFLVALVMLMLTHHLINWIYNAIHAKPKPADAA